MSKSERELHLGLFLFATGYHPAGWRLPEGKADGAYRPDFIAEVAQKLERAKFDYFFLGDRLSSSPDMQHIFPSQMTRLEPFTMIAYVAAVTKQIGLIATANTTYAEPYHIARLTASLDHLSGGRAAWNIVTGADPTAALNFSREEHWDNARRYDYAEEFVDVVTKLWDSWEDESLPMNKESGMFADAAKVHKLHHKGDFFSVEGPLNIVRPVQGQLPLVLAGTSERGRDLGAKVANVIFTAQRSIEDGQEFYSSIKGRLPGFGRTRDEVTIMPGLVPIVGRTSEEARDIYRRMNELLVTNFDLSELSRRIGVELSPAALDDELSEEIIKSVNHDGANWIKLAQKANGREAITVRELFYYFTVTVRGHLLVVGSGKEIADLIEEWFVGEAADGFNVCPPYMPGGLDDFLELVVPELQKKGIFRKEYSGNTFRDHLGLSRPENRFQKVENA
ncbi:LLM class flavin-dependent oxidoreductase [Paenibacillus senegalensis]|uniref:LLM class flavin-dependent oxidoreductase n=1 Tax=Paenibacillus senegalensis TaxID=1465766 RepID=UPI0002898EFD|nr:LLM class flavin-dependent oxidoreductase [Paenibacillus senegalensis]